jgi:hypothetical protein
MITRDRFFSFFFSLSFRESARLFSFLFIFQSQSLCFLLLISVLDPFKKVFYIFNLFLKLQFIYFSNLLLIFFIFDFFLGSFYKILLVFNFIIQSKFMMFYFFPIYPSFLLFPFPFVNLFF